MGEAAHGMGLAEAGETYSKLTIGDGLVSQIPALFISTAAGVLVTKNSEAGSLGQDLLGQISGRPKATLIAAGMLFVIGCLPGMPRLPFFLLATVLVVTWKNTKDLPEGALQSAETELTGAEEQTETGEEDMDELLHVDRLALEVGYRLIPLISDPGGGGVLDHISQLRRRFALNEGVVLPPVRIKDNVRLGPSSYRLLVGGHEVARGEVEPNQFLAMDSGTANGKIRGEETTDPAFGLPAWWIGEDQRDNAEVCGYTVIDPVSVIVTHLSESFRTVLPEVLNRDDTKELIESARKTAPSVVEELIPEKMSYGEVQQVLRNLLREDVSLRSMPTILEVLADNASRTKDPETLTELVRQRLGRALCEQYADSKGVVHAVTLDPDVEAGLANAVGAGHGDEAGAVSPAWLQQLVEQIGEQISQATKNGKDVVLLVRSNVRRFVGELVRASLPRVAVLSYSEVVAARSVETAAVVKMEV
jgi:flagellar biosynthesis protein FlhA